MADKPEPPLLHSTKSLYQLSVSSVAKRFNSNKKCLIYLPENVLFDVYYQVKKQFSLFYINNNKYSLSFFSFLTLFVCFFLF